MWDFWFFSTISEEKSYAETQRVLQPEKGCVFMTVMGEQSSKDFNQFKEGDNLGLAIRDGLLWLEGAQLPNGGYGAGSHNAQNVRDPKAVKADPATTAMVAQAFLRSSLKTKKFRSQLTFERNISF